MLERSRDDISRIVESLYPDDWYDKPEMMRPLMEHPSELWSRPDSFRPGSESARLNSIPTGAGSPRRPEFRR
jgi:hypothetical protein